MWFDYSNNKFLCLECWIHFIFFKMLLPAIMTIDERVRNKALQQDINREAAKISTLIMSGKIGKCKYLTGEEILLLEQHRMMQ